MHLEMHGKFGYLHDLLNREGNRENFFITFLGIIIYFYNNN